MARETPSRPTPHHANTIEVMRFDAIPTPATPARHLGHALVFVLEGTVQIELHGTVTAAAGSFVVVPAGVPHRTFTRQDASCWGVGFCAACLKLAEPDPLMAAFRQVRLGGLPVLPVEPDRAGWIRELFAELRRACESESPTRTTRQRALLTLILTEVHRAAGAPREQPTHDVAARALDHVWANALAGISLKDVAAAVHASPSHVARAVKRATGATVGDWLRATRVAAAAGWLLHSDASIDEIAGRVGWGDTTHFIRQFRKVHGTTPAAFRSAARDGPSE